jgi:3-isopropylmalate/(R)-2-methylmalate dehydratase large subunit
MSRTATEKILSRVVGRDVRAGDIVYPEPDLVTIHDWFVANCLRAVQDLGVKHLYASERLLVCTDHEPTAVSKNAANRQQQVRVLVRQFTVGHFFDVGRGGHGHVFPMEMGIVRPGMFIAGWDPHVTNFGAVGALAIAVFTDIVEVLSCGSTWIRVPETVRVNLNGRLGRGITTRDVSDALMRDLGADLVDYAVVEFAGPALKDVGFGGRMTLCNRQFEIGSKSAFVEPDETIATFLRTRIKEPLELVKSDPKASFKKVLEYDMGLMEPQVSVPPTPDRVVGVSRVAGKPIDYAFIGSCANSSIEDLRDAASILRGRKVASGVRLIITPGTQEVQGRAAGEGLLAVFADAGATLTAPGCGPCAGGNIGPIASGEVSINTGTRNDPGRLGPSDAEIFLASPLTVAASAVRGRICDPREML